MKTIIGVKGKKGNAFKSQRIPYNASAKTRRNIEIHNTKVITLRKEVESLLKPFNYLSLAYNISNKIVTIWGIFKIQSLTKEFETINESIESTESSEITEEKEQKKFDINEKIEKIRTTLKWMNLVDLIRASVGTLFNFLSGEFDIIISGMLDLLTSILTFRVFWNKVKNFTSCASVLKR